MFRESSPAARRSLTKLLAFFTAAFLSAGAAEPEADAKDLPRIPATEPAQAAATFKIREGFKIELAASEPNVASPVAISFDEDSRMYVVEMRDYSEHRDESLGRIRRLEDTDGDGLYEKSVIFADRLAWPTAVICYNGGIFVGVTPDILFLRDNDGDGKADERKVIFTGFGKGVERLNVQQLLNSFNWGLDNRIHGATAGNGGAIEQVASKAPALKLGSRDFSFDPRTLVMRPETGGGQHGFSFDDQGRKFVTQNSSHIRMVVYEDRYLPTNISSALPPAVVDIAKEGPAAEVFRISPEEPWRTIRTKWRVAGQVSGPIEGGGRASGYFTGATGVTIYRGDAYPPEFRGNAFVGDAGGNLVHRKIFRENGVLLEASRPSDELNREFLASTDTWFRPVQFANGPDGCLYVIDMYREVIEHPWSLPPGIKKHLDLDSGRDRGRIWRIVPENFQRPPLPKLSKATTEDLAKLLNHPNAWTRDTAARLLYERHTLSANIAAAGLSEQGLRLIENLPANEQTKALKSIDPASSSNLRILHQYAWTLSVIETPDRIDHLAKLATQTDDQWIETAIVIAARNDAAALFHRLIDAPKMAASVSLLSKLVTQLSAADRELAFKKTAQIKRRADAFRLAAAILKSSTALDGSSLFAEAMSAIKEAPGTDVSQEALNLLRLADTTEAEAIFKMAFRRATSGTFNTDQLSEIEPAFRGLLNNPKTAAATLWEEWKNLSVHYRAWTLDQLLNRSEGPTLVIDALRSKKIGRFDLTASQTQTLRQHPNPAISRPALELLGQLDSNRATVIERLRPALAQQGDLKIGARIFATRCASCHRLTGQGSAVGPDLESVRGNGREYLLIHMIDPNREVNSRFISYTAGLADGETIDGLLARETDGAVTLRRANAEEKTIPRAQIKTLSASTLSLMPVGLEEGLTIEEIAALLDYVQTAK